MVNQILRPAFGETALGLTVFVFLSIYYTILVTLSARLPPLYPQGGQAAYKH